MKIGLIISMYDEIAEVNTTIENLSNKNCQFVVIQSDPHEKEKILDKKLVNHYELLPDLAGSKENYENERTNEMEGTVTPAKALSRNFSCGFKAAKKMDVDWWVIILGDVSVSNLIGTKKIIEKMTLKGKSIGITRAVGQKFMDKQSKFTRIQRKETTDFMPQYFIVKDDLVKNNFFNEIKITNIHTPEQCFGDAILEYCRKNSVEFFDLVYSICDYPFPKFIDGLTYNPDKAVLPRYIDGVLNAWRRFKTR